jgi:Fe-S cluster biogenesis protein NfuA
MVGYGRRSLNTKAGRFNNVSLYTSPFFNTKQPAYLQVMTTPNMARIRNMFIQVQNTPNPDSLKFIPGAQVTQKGTMEFPNAMSAIKSPLAKSLFQIEGVKQVFFARDFISVNKDTDADWNVLKPQVFSAIMEFYDSGKPIVTDEKPREDTMIKPDDSEAVQMIKEVLETRIRPAVQDDGGDIEYRGFENGVVLLKMQGSCSGCQSSSVTLKSGIERMLKHFIPEVTAVVAVTDDDLEKINLEHFTNLETKKSQEDKQQEQQG